MIKIKDLLAQLWASDLNSTSAFDANGYPLDKNLPRFTSLLNLALKNLFNRFDYKIKEVVFQSFDWKSIYTLSSEFADTNKDSISIKYIRDSPLDPFKDDIVQIRAVCNELGQPLYMNDDNQSSSIYILDYRTIQLTHPCNDDVFSVLYKASYPDVLQEDLATGTLDIPQVLEEPLRTYMASLYFNAQSGQDSSVTVQRLENKYELLCQDIAKTNKFGLDLNTTNTKGYLRGWF